MAVNSVPSWRLLMPAIGTLNVVNGMLPLPNRDSSALRKLPLKVKA